MIGVGRIAEVCAIYVIGVIVFDYCCYYQATIFATLDHSRRGMDNNYRDPPYHPFAHWSLWILAAAGFACWIAAFALNMHADLGLIFAGVGGAYFFTRYVLMRRGIS